MCRFRYGSNWELRILSCRITNPAVLIISIFNAIHYFFRIINPLTTETTPNRAQRRTCWRTNPVYNAYTGLLRQQVVSQWRKGCKATIRPAGFGYAFLLLARHRLHFGWLNDQMVSAPARRSQIRKDRTSKVFLDLFWKRFEGFKKGCIFAPDSTRLASHKNCGGSFFYKWLINLHTLFQTRYRFVLPDL